MEHFWILAVASLVVGASKGGLATAAALAVPFLSVWMDPLAAAGILLPIFLVSDCVGIWLYRREFSTKNVVLLIVSGFVGVIIAMLIAADVSTPVATFLTGLIGLYVCLQAFVKALRRQNEAAPFDAPRGFFWGVVTGITSFVSHTGAPPFQSFVLPQRLPKLQYAGTNTFVFAAINLFKLPAYVSVGLMDGFEWRLFAVLALIATAGAVLGRVLAQWLSEDVYRRVIYALLFILSVYLIVTALIDMIAH